MHRVKVRVVEDALDANNTLAQANRADFDRHGVTVVNLMGAPGAGKTALLEQCSATGLGDIRLGILEGDVEGSLDADRLARLHVPVTQINTGGGLRRRVPPRRQHGALGARCVPLDEIDLLVIENVGNLVCPAEFRVGEDARVMVTSVTEGEDKPLKYPLMFRACDLVVVNKVDLLPHLDVDLELLLHRIDKVHPDVPVMVVSGRTGEGVDAVRHWLRELHAVSGGAHDDGVVTARVGADALRAHLEAAVADRADRPRRGSRPRPSGSRRSATRWPSGSPATAGCSRSAAPPPRAPTSTTWRWSSCTR